MNNCKFAFYFAVFAHTICAVEPPHDCVPEEIDRLCRQHKCAGIISFPNCENVVNSYLGGNQCCNQNTLMALPKKKSKRQFYNFDFNPAAKWTSPVPYYLNFSESNIELIIRRAINVIESSTCISFSRSSTQPQEPHIVFNRFSQGCVSFVGRSEKLASPIYGDDSCFEKPGVVLYLIVQTLGLWHQTQRPDAKDHVRILYENMDQSHWADFIPVSMDYIVTLGYEYDYASLTHYGGKVFSKNGQPTIETLDISYQQTIGQKVELSFQDAKLMNFFYCKDRCPMNLDCMNGGYTNANNCSACICPDGFKGVRCEVFRVDRKTSIEPGDCGDELLATSENQELTSPGYSRNFYPPYTHCQWIITAPRGRIISMKFVENFGLYSDELDACQHWIEIRFKPPFNRTGPRFCGPKLPIVNINSSSNKVLIIFKSNDIGTIIPPQGGFKLQYTISDNHDSCVPNPCLNNGSCASKGNFITCLCRPKYSGDRCQIELENSTHPCTRNPCRNNGKCHRVGTAFICLCKKPFYGRQCQHANCGGCDTKPGLVCDAKCYSESNNCSVKSNWSLIRNFLKFFMFYDSNICEDADSLCCDNAVEINSKCAALGWTKWSKCSSSCGPGQQMRYRYGVQDGFYKILENGIKNCTGEFCRKSRHTSFGWC